MVNPNSKMRNAVLIFLFVLHSLDSAPIDRRSKIVSQYYSKAMEIQARLDAHFAEQRKPKKPDGTPIYQSVYEVQQLMKRPYHPNVGFYTPMNPPISGLTDPRCTKRGMLGCGDRCFIPLNTNCINGQVIGPEASIDSALLPATGDALPGVVSTVIGTAAQAGISAASQG